MDTKSPFTRKSLPPKLQGKQKPDLEESELRIWHPNENKDHLYASSLNVQDPSPVGGIQLVPSYFPATDCRWQSIESLKGIPYSSCLLIRLKGRAQPQRTWKGIQDEGRWCEISYGMEVNAGSDRKREREEREVLGKGGDWEEIGWGREEALRPQQDNIQFTPGRPQRVDVVVDCMDAFLARLQSKSLQESLRNTWFQESRAVQDDGHLSHNFPLRFTTAGDYVKILFFWNGVNYNFVECYVCVGGGCLLVSDCDLSVFTISFIMETHKSDDPLWFTACKVFSWNDSMMKACTHFKIERLLNEPQEMKDHNHNI